jgi:putative ABC transport system permease protein
VVAQAYLPYAVGWTWGGYLTARISGDPATVVGDLRAAVVGVDPLLPPGDVVALDERVERSLAQRRFYTTLFGVFALAALLLAAAGIYGTVSYFVARRVRDLGVRMALGAGETGILTLVLRRGLRLALYGISLGLLGAWASARVLESLLYEVEAVSPGTLLVGSRWGA